jgi:tetratricopeptide (TPR) repeat protein
MGMTPVHLAAQYDDIDTIKLFYEGLPEKPTSEVEKFMVLRVPGRNDHYGYMPLHTAIHSSALRVAEYLLEKRSPVRCSHEFIPLSALIAFNRNDTMEKMKNLVDKYVSKEISDNMGNMSKKTIFCDIDIIASNHTMVVTEKPISQEEKTQKKMIEQFNEMTQQQRYNWCTQIGSRLEKTLGSTKFAKDEQFAKNVAAVLEQAPISAEMSEDHRNVQTNILTAAYYLVAASRQVLYDYREAITWASKAIRVNKYFAQAYQVRGSSYEQLGDIQNSQRDLEIYMQLIQQF